MLPDPGRKRWSKRRVVLLTAFVLQGLVIGWPPCHGQEVRQPVILPPTRGATVLSTYIDAQARHAVAVGSLLESAARARIDHATARQQEIQNSVDWVRSYFEIKDINRAYRLKENPPYLDDYKARERMIRRRITDTPSLALQGDVTNELNWILNQLGSAALAYEHFFSEGESAAISDQPLSPDDIRHIRFTEAAALHGQRLSFRADDPQVLGADWPVALRAPEFDEYREEFEVQRKLIQEELQSSGAIGLASGQQLRAVVDRMAQELNERYPRERRADPEQFLLYNRSKMFLQYLALSISRVLAANNLDALERNYKFEGASVMELIQHATKHGLEFAPPASGDEATYRKLLIAMRHIYLQLPPER